MSEPENLILTMLREMRATLADVKSTQADHSEHLAAIRKDLAEWQETTATATGFSVHANLRTQAIEAELAALKRRVETLERAQ